MIGTGYMRFLVSDTWGVRHASARSGAPGFSNGGDVDIVKVYTICVYAKVAMQSGQGEV
jgi:hypothetical protein